MRKKFYIRALFIFLIIFLRIAADARAQSQTPVSGPSDNAAAPPANVTDVARIVCFGGTITLKSNLPASKYRWYKVTNGNLQLVQENLSPQDSYTEQSAGAGYYKYQLSLVNEHDCESEKSEEINVFVLPDLLVTVARPGSAVICSQNKTTSVLNAVIGTEGNYSYTYQWTRNGQDITGATEATYTVSEETAGNVSFAVRVGYALNSECQKTSAPVSIEVSEVPGKPVIIAAE